MTSHTAIKLGQTKVLRAEPLVRETPNAVIVYLEDGNVTNVLGLPQGFTLEIREYAVDDMDGEDLGQVKRDSIGVRFFPVLQ